MRWREDSAAARWVFGVDEDLGPVLVADVTELPMSHERIDVAPEVIEQLVVGHDGGVEDDLDRLGMPGAAA